MTDHITKVLLTVIAAALVTISIKMPGSIAVAGFGDRTDVRVVNGEWEAIPVKVIVGD